MKRLCLILLLATMAQSASALTRQQEQVISATGFALFVGDHYYPACEHHELDDGAVQSAWRSAGLNPDRYMDKTHFRGTGDVVGNHAHGKREAGDQFGEKKVGKGAFKSSK